MSKYITMHDAIHGTMSLPDSYRKLFKSIIDNRYFQRLRHIKQLGLADLVFPTATHTRFSHCVGAAHIAYKICESLGSDIISSHIQLHAVIGALLHDIGHGPFSHAFEKIIRSKNIKKV